MTGEQPSTTSSTRGAVYIVSGGAGTSAELLVRTALAQFPGEEVPVVIIPHVRTVDELEEVSSNAARDGGMVLHTLVSRDLRDALRSMLTKKNVLSLDLMGPLLSSLSERVERAPVGRPGLYRKLRETYFSRIDAVEYAVAHDDGRGARDWHLADIFILGVSRCGKTPLSMYLALQGLKTANLPLVFDIAPPDEIFTLDRKKMVGLTIDIVQLMMHRRARQQRLGMGREHSNYWDAETLEEELRSATRLYRQLRIPIVDVTHKPIEETAQEILDEVNRRRSR